MNTFWRVTRIMTHRLTKKYRFSETTVLIVLACIVGLATALGAVAFIRLILYAKGLFFGSSVDLVHLVSQDLQYWEILIPAVGGLLVGPIVYKFAKEAKGHGVPEVMVAVAFKGGMIRPRVAIAKAVASAICIGSGGSAGREGPIVQIGAAIGSVVGQIFHMSERRVRVLVGCGAAAGISAVFNAPIAGVIFSLEIILGDFAVKTFAPVILSSVVASVVSRSLLGNSPAFMVPKYALISAYEIPLYVVLGLICGIVAVTFTRVLFVAEDLSDNAKIPGILKPAVGGLLLGTVAIFLPQIYADGYESIHAALSGEFGIAFLFILIFAKIFATSLTLGSGNSGGIFAPSLFMGAMAGGWFGSLVHQWFPTVTAPSGAYALVGMAAVVAGTTHAPITAILIVFEMTGDYRIILPVMVACVFATLAANKILPESIYTLKLVRQGINLKRGKDQEVLDTHKVREVMRSDFISIPPQMPLRAIMALMEKSNQMDFPIVDHERRYIGMVSFNDLRQALAKDYVADLVVAQDLAHTEYPHLHEDDSLGEAFQKLGVRDLSSLAVLGLPGNERVSGLLLKSELTSYYNRRLVEKFNTS
ncbi:MAG: chloride channel protein [bacterium]